MCRERKWASDVCSAYCFGFSLFFCVWCNQLSEGSGKGGGSRHTTLQEQLLFLVAEVEIQANAGCNEQCSSFWCEYLMNHDINTNKIWKRNMKHTPTAALSLPAPCPGTSGEEEYGLHRVICGALLDTSSKCLCVCTRRERKERTFRDRHVGGNMIK